MVDFFLCDFVVLLCFLPSCLGPRKHVENSNVDRRDGVFLYFGGRFGRVFLDVKM